MKIKLEKHYQNARGVKLAPGIHDLDKALAAYLVDNGHADYVDEPAQDTPYPDTDAIVQDLQSDSPALPDEDDRDAIKAELDKAGIEYSKYANTDSLYDLLLESNS